MKYNQGVIQKKHSKNKGEMKVEIWNNRNVGRQLMSVQMCISLASLRVTYIIIYNLESPAAIVT